jgi:hypothetical protein
MHQTALRTDLDEPRDRQWGASSSNSLSEGCHLRELDGRGTRGVEN